MSPLSANEKTLQSLWSKLLRIDVDQIGAVDSFTRLGGDSILAMRLVSAARQVGLSITTADVIRHPCLRDLASLSKPISSRSASAEHSILPFSLLPRASAAEDVQQQAALRCAADKYEVEDVFPCTPLQEGLLAMTVQRGGYEACIVRQLHAKVDVKRFVRAWEQVIWSTPILRTRLVDIPGQGLLQAVVRSVVPCTVTTDDLDTFLCQEQQQQSPGLGDALSRYCLVTDRRTGYTFFVWHVHHALYDGWSLPLILGSPHSSLSRSGATWYTPLPSLCEARCVERPRQSINRVLAEAVRQSRS